MTQCGGSWSWPYRLAAALGIGGAIITLSGNCSLAQNIKPDTTLGPESTVLKRNVLIDRFPSDRIDGGAKRGANLFHSFQEFNIGESQRAYFANPTGVKNILSRVTGNDPSNILGTLGVLGKANLFLINPNGIIFGPNASLDVQGSFVGTTANAVGLTNGDTFSTDLTKSFPSQLLNVNPNAFFLNQIETQPIINRSIASSARLQVPAGQSLLLVGGDISLDSGTLQAPGGQVELGGVARAGTIELIGAGNSLSLSFPNSVRRADMSLTKGSKVNVRAGGGGSITINAQNLNMVGGSTLLAGIDSGLGSVGSQAGDVEINANKSINLTAKSIIDNSVLPRATGKGGNIDVMTETLEVTDGARLTASSRGKANGGNVTIDARDLVSFDGGSVFSRVEETGKGKGGNIGITSGLLFLTNGALLTASSRGVGDAGNVTINVRDQVSFDGIGRNKTGSGAFSTVEETGIGEGGNINITTGSLFITNGAQLAASTYGEGDAGNVTINARDQVSFDGIGGIGKNTIASLALSTVGPTGDGEGGNIDITTGSLFVTNGAQLAAGTRGIGDAGNVKINARNQVSFDGMGRNKTASGAFSTVEETGIGEGGNIDITTGSLFVTNGAALVAGTRGIGDAGNVKINARDQVSFDGIGKYKLRAFSRASRAFSTVEETGIGEGGNINITTGSLFVTNGAELSASSRGSRSAGNLEFRARFIQLDRQGKLTTEAASGQGGNITLQLQDLLLLRHGSNISTTAGTDQAGGDGGNIKINTDLIVAFPNEDSDITANAFKGQGGNIGIEAQGVFGLEERRATPGNGTNDIDASSELGVSGNVQLNTPDVDPSQGLVALPEEVVDVSGLIAQTCPAGSGPRQSKFVATGRGGLPPNPGETLNTDAVQVDLVTLNPEVDKSSAAAVPSSPTSPASTPMVEAQGWVRDAKGNVVLTASTSTVESHSSWQKTANCLKPRQ